MNTPTPRHRRPAAVVNGALASWPSRHPRQFALVAVALVAGAIALLVSLLPGESEGGTGLTSPRRTPPATIPVSTPPPAAPLSSPSATPSAPPPLSPAPSTKAPQRVEGWEITVYYTAVEELHSGKRTEVRGCLDLGCEWGDSRIGTYPRGFVRAVEDEGTGRITSGEHAGKYLNWSYDVGYWLDSAPRDSYGEVLVAFRSAAADNYVLAPGSSFRVADCGRDGGTPLEPEVCARLQEAQWRISDEFTPELGGAGRLDLYIGEESGEKFTSSPWYATMQEAAILV